MAEIDSQRVDDGFELLALPGPALDAVARAVKPKGSLLRTSTACRDAVLAACKVAKLATSGDETEGQVKAHQPLLRRVGTQAAPGLWLSLFGRPLNCASPSLSGLLASSTCTPLELPSVHHLKLQVMSQWWCF
jgi:hypothetical protein